MDQVSTPPSDSLTVYRRLLRDDRVSHGAFRLWHYLRDRANDENVCWPQQRTIAKDMHCKPHSLSGWIDELEESGYLAVESKGANHHFVYRILDGSALPISATRGVAQKGNTKPAALPKPATPALPISAFRDAQTGNARVAQMGNVSNNNEVIPLSKAVELNKGDAASSLGGKLTPQGRRANDLVDRCRELFGDDEMKNSDNHRQWVELAINDPIRLEKVLNETANAVKEGRVKTTIPRYAQDYYGRIK